MKEHDFTEVVSLIVKEDPRYAKNGYLFLQKALNFTIDKERKRQGKVVTKVSKRHVCGQELLDGIREYALDQYGPMAHYILTSWGITKCEDFGEMVFNLIEYGVFSKNENDSREDFSATYTFKDAFLKPFQPKEKKLKRPVYRAIESL
ncbi:hypothetical protein VDG1235_1774 [Verrucomicrobiia bacterium DG1235]|nr:hypothetical protein VDG1235_1774 [Verrucomicrobiae bacterium DG1235]